MSTVPDAWREERFPSPFGDVRVAYTERGIAAASLEPADVNVRRALERRFVGGWPGAADPPGWLGPARDAVAAADPAALADPAVPLDLTGLPAWDARVYALARTIPPGSVTSYGRLARAAGAPRAARAVGGAMGRNPFWLFVPCHRVIPADGMLGGYGRGAWSLELKRSLLEREGVRLPATEFWG
jgi:O-6-methylguanine DNA methyltransferase